MKTNLIIGWIMVSGAIVLAIWFIVLLRVEGPLPGIGNMRAFIVIPFIFLYGLWCLRKAREQKAESGDGESK